MVISRFGVQESGEEMRGAITDETGYVRHTWHSQNLIATEGVKTFRMLYR